MKKLTVLLLATLSGCATILAGRSQNISIDSNPPGARCEVWREGRVVATVEKTPGAAYLDKTKHDLTVTCKKDGFADSTAFADSGNEGSVFGNILLGGPIGWGIDSAVGADNHYPDRVMVNLSAPEQAAKK